MELIDKCQALQYEGLPFFDAIAGNVWVGVLHRSCIHDEQDQLGTRESDKGSIIEPHLVL